MKKSLKERAAQLSATLEIMEGRDKAEMDNLIGQHVTINDFDFLAGDKGEDFAVFTIAEMPQVFFFGGGVISDHLKTLENDGYKDAIKVEGLPVKFEKKKSKNNRFYVNAILFPED